MKYKIHIIYSGHADLRYYITDYYNAFTYGCSFITDKKELFIPWTNVTHIEEYHEETK
jgi:hypothetical protein